MTAARPAAQALLQRPWQAGQDLTMCQPAQLLCRFGLAPVQSHCQEG